MVVMDVLDVIMSAPAAEPVWGLQICEQTGRGSGTVYPALDRLTKAGWISDRWESPAPADRPRRRFYSVTQAGREQYGAALASHASRRVSWVRAQAAVGGADD
jgi:PadR family transcriptional regulator, regulatory protein PadR